MLQPGIVPGDAEGVGAGLQQSHRLQRLLRKMGTLTTSVHPAAVADHRDMPAAVALYVQEPLERPDPELTHFVVARVMPSDKQGVGELGVGVGQAIVTPRPIFRGVGLET